MVRILYHHRIRADDGQAVHVRQLILALRAQGHQVLECALVPKAQAPSELAAPPSRWSHLHLPRAAAEIAEMLYNRRGVAQLRRAARDFRPDFIYERHALHCYAGLTAARLLGVPLLLEVNAPMCDEMERLGLLRMPRRARRTERLVLGGADRVIAVTEVLRQRLIECGADPRRCLVIGNGADPALYSGERDAQALAVRARLHLPADAFVIGFVGFMRPWHRLEHAVTALAQPGLERVHLLLVGNGPALADVIGAAATAGVSARLHAIGAVPAAALPAHLGACDAALIPGINRYASPLKLFDSLAAAVPTLAPDQPNLREIITDAVDGVLFEPGSPPALTDRIRFLLADAERARAIGRAGRRRLLECDWTWAGNARRTLAAYEAVVAERAEVRR